MFSLGALDFKDCVEKLETVQSQTEMIKMLKCQSHEKKDEGTRYIYFGRDEEGKHIATFRYLKGYYKENGKCSSFFDKHRNK